MFAQLSKRYQTTRLSVSAMEKAQVTLYISAIREGAFSQLVPSAVF
jgi:hypothetical protein